MDAQTWWVAALSAIFGGGIIFRLRFGNGKEKAHPDLEARLKDYFGERFDAIAVDIRELRDDGDKRDEKYETFYKEFTDLRIELAKRFGMNGHNKETR